MSPRRVAGGGRLREETADVAAAVALRLGVSRAEVTDRTRNSDVLRTLTTSRLEAVIGLLERAGYSPAERVSALVTVCRGRPERLRRRLELCRRLGMPRPSLALLAMGQKRFERRVAKWRRKAGLEREEEEEVVVEEWEGWGDSEVGDGVSGEFEAGDWGDVDEVIGGDEAEGETHPDSEDEMEYPEGTMHEDDTLAGEELIVNVHEEGQQADENSRDVDAISVRVPGSKGLEIEKAFQAFRSEGSVESKELEDDPEYLSGSDILKEKITSKDTRNMRSTPKS